MQEGKLTAWELFCRRGDRLLFGSLDLALDPGQSMHLVGPNGIGKSSLIQILAGLRQPSYSLDVAAATDGHGRGIANWTGSVALLDERPALDLDQPLGKALSFWSSIDGCKDNTEIFEKLGLDDLLEVPVRYLSTGQKKRSALASVLARGASNWLLDEPLNGLDEDAKRIVEELIADHCARGGTCVVASHQPIEMPQKITLDIRDHPW